MQKPLIVYNNVPTFNNGVLVSGTSISLFDVDKPTRVCMDASREGLGFFMQLRMAEWHLVIAV